MNEKRELRRRAERNLLFPVILFLVVSTVAAQMASPNYHITSSVLSTSGGTGSSANFGVQTSMGQPGATGISQSPNYGAYGGFQPSTLDEFPEWVPHIHLSSGDVDFGQVKIGRSSDRVLTVSNHGLGTLEVSGMSSDDAQFTCAPENMSMGGLGSADVTVTFVPLGEGACAATLTLQCNDSEQPVVQVHLYGVGVVGCPGGDLGDVTGDTDIDVLDVLAVVNHILGLVHLDENEQCRADCNGDDDIDILDALAIVNVILGLLTECPGNGICKPQITSEVITFLKALDPYLSSEEFTRFMALVERVRVPDEYLLAQNYPNPFNPTTTIRYTIPVSGERGLVNGSIHTTLKIYNILGQEVRTLVDEVREPGYYTVTWDGRNEYGSGVACGVYFYRLAVGGYTATKRMVLMK